MKILNEDKDMRKNEIIIGVCTAMSAIIAAILIGIRPVFWIIDEANIVSIGVMFMMIAILLGFILACRIYIDMDKYKKEKKND